MEDRAAGTAIKVADRGVSAGTYDERATKQSPKESVYHHTNSINNPFNPERPQSKNE